MVLVVVGVSTPGTAGYSISNSLWAKQKLLKRKTKKLTKKNIKNTFFIFTFGNNNN